MHCDVSKEAIESFLNGTNPMERIIKIELDYREDHAKVFYRNEQGIKTCELDPYYPFVWTKQTAARCFFNGNRELLKKKMYEYGIGCKGLIVQDKNGNIPQRMENGYRVMFFAKIPMSFGKFMDFFNEAGRPIYPKETDKNYGLRDYIVVAPNEQHMISTGKRLFKGYQNYDDLLRFIWDLETEGLEAEKHKISQIGIRTNKGFEKIIKIEGDGTIKYDNEIIGIGEFFKILREIDPDIVTGQNTEAFDWNFYDIRLQQHGSSLAQFTQQYFDGRGIYKKKKESVLKLGGEMEYYRATVKYGTNLTDSLHAIRRAQALDSSMKKADLKYVTKYSKLNKKNRVYVPGKIINKTWEDSTRTYAFNDEDGEWFKITDSLLSKTIDGTENKRYEFVDHGEGFVDHSKNDKKYQIVTGTYIVERYLLDDLYETDKVEIRYNESNFLVGKMLPVSFEKMCTMGTAAIWKYIMLAWSYEHDLAVPDLIESKKFTGGLSRLLSVGYADRVVKLDYNSLYPSIILSYAISSPIDISGVMNALLEYILSQREYYKTLKGLFGAKAKEIKKLIDENKVEDLNKALAEVAENEAEATKNDKMQLPLKITGNGYFGSFGSGHVFPWSDINAAEMTTCVGRMCLRLMISHFKNVGKYRPIVGDSFTPDTPLFIKYNDTKLIDIKPVSELIDEEEINIDALGREYDYSEKGYKVLCRSGWVEPSYIYRHKTNKPIYEVYERSMSVEVTEDHSLFDETKNKIKPSEITTETKLEYYTGKITDNSYLIDNELFMKLLNETIEKKDRIPVIILNSDVDIRHMFYKLLVNKLGDITIEKFSKTFVAGANFLIM